MDNQELGQAVSGSYRVEAAPATEAIKFDDYKEFGTDAQITALYAAMAQARGEFGKIVQNRTARISKDGKLLYEFTYADMDQVLEAVVPALSKHGLVVMQPPGSVLRTILAHKGGARIMSVMELPKAGDIKTHGGNITYLRRYALNALLCLAADADADDMPNAKQGETGAQSGPRRTPEVPKAGAPDQNRSSVNAEPAQGGGQRHFAGSTTLASSLGTTKQGNSTGSAMTTAPTNSSAQTTPEQSHSSSRSSEARVEPEPPSQHQVARLYKLFGELGVTTKPGMGALSRELAGVASSAELNSVNIEKLITGLEGKLSAKAAP